MDVRPESFVIGYADSTGKISIYQRLEWAGAKIMVFNDLENATLAAARLTREYRNTINWQVYRMKFEEVEALIAY